MQQSSAPEKGGGIVGLLTSTIGRILISFLIPAISFVVLWQGFLFLRDSEAPKLVISIVAIIWGVGGVALLFWVFNWIVEQLSKEWTARLQPFVFIGPAMAILIWYLALPTLRTTWISLFGRDGSPAGLFSKELSGLAFAERWSVYTAEFAERWVGLSNYQAVFTDRTMLEAFRNNIMWLIIGTGFSVVVGLLISVLADRSKYERFAKSLIFLPMAISFVGAGIIWNFIYEVKPVGSSQIGLLNALLVSLGQDPQPFTAWTAIAPWNNLFLIVIVVWLQTGYAMTLFSAALKGIPGELLEAGRVDGATEVQIFFRIMVPYIKGTIVTVATTIAIFTLKIFDVVLVMTGGQFGTEVIATNFYRQYFSNRNFGFGSAIAIVLLIAVIPVMVYNLKQFSEQEAF